MNTRENKTQIRTEAAIYAEGTALTTDQMYAAYTSYADRCDADGDEPLDFQRWADGEGYGTGGCRERRDFRASPCNTGDYCED